MPKFKEMVVSEDVTLYVEGHPILFEKGDKITIVDSVDESLEDTVNTILMESANDKIDGTPPKIDNGKIVVDTHSDDIIMKMADTIKEEDRKLDPDIEATLARAKEKREQDADQTDDSGDDLLSTDTIDDKSADEDEFDTWVSQFGIKSVDGQYVDENGKMIESDELIGYQSAFEEQLAESEPSDVDDDTADISDIDAETGELKEPEYVEDEVDTYSPVETGLPTEDDLDLRVLGPLDKEFMDGIDSTVHDVTGQDFFGKKIIDSFVQ